MACALVVPPDGHVSRRLVSRRSGRAPRLPELADLSIQLTPSTARLRWNGRVSGAPVRRLIEPRFNGDSAMSSPHNHTYR
jgi:hypothetical protein